MDSSLSSSSVSAQPLVLHINGHTRRVHLDPAMPLVFALRDHLGLTGTKYSCLEGVCGACTVHVDGAAVRACLMPVSAAVGRRLHTIEGLKGPDAEALREAWTHHGVAQCGYCQSGQLMHAAAQLPQWRQPSAGGAAAGAAAGAAVAADRDDDLTASVRAVMGQVLCRCGSYQRIQDAVVSVVRGGSAGAAGARS